MEYLLVLLVATTVSLAVVPIMIRLAPFLGMLDQPDPRKVHAKPIPRVGGWGIVLGALITVLIWAPMDRLLLTYVFGSSVLLAFGAWDDRKELGHFTKFLGQFIAVLPVVTYGGLYVTLLPFGIEPLGPAAGILFTVVAMVGMINAINHSDGLDGLAGGESLLSLGAIAVLTYLSGGILGVTIAFAALGGILGFLRYNTHPASVFMGDAGSQFLGFTLGFLAVLLTQRSDTTLSPTVTLLLLGLPIADIIAVLVKRIRGGMNWFQATKNHIHHRLLALGFVHRESVVTIYALQSLLVTSGLLLRHTSDWLITALYLAVCFFVFGSLHRAERSGWSAHGSGRHERLRRALFGLEHRYVMVVLPRRFLEFAIPLFLVVGALLTTEVPHDVGIVSAIVLGLLVAPYVARTTRSIIRNGFTYVVAALVVYLTTNYPPSATKWFWVAQLVFFMTVALSVVVALRFSPRRRRAEFYATPMDYLLVLVTFAALVATALFSRFPIFESANSAFIVYLGIILYACELLIVERRKQNLRLGAAALLATGVLVFRSLI